VTRAAGALLAVLALWPAAAPAPARAADANTLTRPADLDHPPASHRLAPRAVIAIAERIPKVRAARRRHRGSYPAAYEKGPFNWQVSYFDRAGHEIAQVLIADASGRVLEAWTGFQVAWTMARGYPGAFGRKVNALYIWLPLCLLFVAPFFDRRRPLRLLHLDLLVLVLFSVSLAFFNDGEVGRSVPLAYPPLLYVLARMLWIGLRGRGTAAAGALRLAVPASWLAIGVVFLIGFRVGLNVTNSNVIDVGYSGVIGAHQLVDGKPLYGHFPADNPHGDTYGPFAYEAYVPFERTLGFSGRWDDLPAAHGAAIVFDLLCVALLFLIGRRVRGPTLGVALAYAWVAYPFTLYVTESNTNDALVAALLLAAVLAASSPSARGALGALAGMTKLAPLALAPLLATHGPQRRPLRSFIVFALAFAAVAALALEPALTHGTLRTVYDRTVTYQATRGSPFSVWGLYGGIGWLQTATQLAAVALALAVAVLPRRPDVIGLAALAAAVLIALQLGVTHWFYLYIPWFFGLAIIALLGRYEEPA
jgi:hypothetical protein